MQTRSFFDWSSDVCSSDLSMQVVGGRPVLPIGGDLLGGAADVVVQLEVGMGEQRSPCGARVLAVQAFARVSEIGRATCRRSVRCCEESVINTTGVDVM